MAWKLTLYQRYSRKPTLHPFGPKPPNTGRYRARLLCLANLSIGDGRASSHDQIVNQSRQPLPVNHACGKANLANPSTARHQLIGQLLGAKTANLRVRDMLLKKCILRQYSDDRIVFLVDIAVESHSR